MRMHVPIGALCIIFINIKWPQFIVFLVESYSKGVYRALIRKSVLVRNTAQIVS